MVPALSPDGKWVAYEKYGVGQTGMYIERFPLDGRPIQVSSTDGAFEAFFSAKGDKLFYRAGRGVMQVPLTVTGDRMTLGKPTMYVEFAFADFLGRSLHAGARRPIAGETAAEHRSAIGDSRHDRGSIVSNREAEQHIKVHKTTREAVAIFEGFDLVAEPGTRYSYSSYGYNLLGAAIEGAAAAPYESFMRENVWIPLGMTETRMDDPAALIPNRVRGYRLANGELQNSEFIDVSSRFAAGGTRGTVPDLLRFVRGVQTGKLLSPKSLELVYAPMKTRDGRPIAYSAGWQIPPFVNRGTMVVNDGGQQETRTFMLNAPEKGFGLALGMNLEADVYAPIVFRLYELILGEKLEIDRR